MKNKNLAIVFVVVLTVAVFGGFIIFTRNNSSVENTKDSNPQSLNPQNNSFNQEYSDGNYSQTVKYTSPAGEETVRFDIVLLDNKIANVEMEEIAIKPASRTYLDNFNDGINTEIVGNEIENYSPSAINGASLTTNAFKEALEKVRNQAEI